jgi:hypothetical protein
MKLGIMQPYFFPYVGYWQLINVVDKYVIYDDVNFIKGGWINRNNILMSGEAKLISLQLQKASPNKLINEIEIHENTRNIKKLLKTIESNYKSAPYYATVFPMLENIITYDEKNLAEYLKYSITQICDFLSIDTEIIVSSTINKDNDLRGQDKVIEICKMLDADEYINAIGGQTLYSIEDFNKEEINLRFLKTGNISYEQFDNELFIPNLSIIDVMMFNSRDHIKEILQMYQLV